MSDESVRAALRSEARLVVVEAPAGCGKTYQGAEFARELASASKGRLLILTHTHSATDVFAKRITGFGANVDVRTIHSLIAQIATAYHSALGLPKDIVTWLREADRYDELAKKVSTFIIQNPIIGRELVRRYRVLICDEHQDADAHQHALVMAYHAAGGQVRIFGDPMQLIFGASANTAQVSTRRQQWETLKSVADQYEELDTAHRWTGNGAAELGIWMLQARAALAGGSVIQLAGALPPGLNLIYADNSIPDFRGYKISTQDGRSMRSVITASPKIMVLARHNAMVGGLRAYLGRQLPIWEGHDRDNLSTLCKALKQHAGNPVEVARATARFIQSVAVGFSNTAFANMFVAEVENGCASSRLGKRAFLRDLGKHLLQSPDHRGVAAMLSNLAKLITDESSFSPIHIDRRKEYMDAIQMGTFSDADLGFAEISHRRTYSRPLPPDRCISTIHKAKGMEYDAVMIVGCNATSFPDSPSGRALLYVAVSRATRSLTLVLSRTSPSPLLVR